MKVKRESEVAQSSPTLSDHMEGNQEYGMPVSLGFLWEREKGRLLLSLWTNLWLSPPHSQGYTLGLWRVGRVTEARWEPGGSCTLEAELEEAHTVVQRSRAWSSRHPWWGAQFYAFSWTLFHLIPQYLSGWTKQVFSPHWWGDWGAEFGSLPNGLPVLGQKPVFTFSAAYEPMK